MYLDLAMTTLSTTRKEIIKDAIEFLNVIRIPTTVRIEGDETLFLSKIVEVHHVDLLSSGTSERLVIEDLSTKEGSLKGLPPGPEAILPFSFQPSQLMRNTSEWGSTLT